MALRPHRCVLVWLAVIWAPLAASCEPSPRSKPAKPKTVLIEAVPHVRQEPDFCGEACAEMFCRKLGAKIDQDDVFNQAGLDPQLGRGCHTRELAVALKKLGFAVGSVWYRIDARKPDKPLASLWNALLADLKKGVPSIVCTRFADRPNASEHFRLVLGYDPAKKQVIYHEPAEEKGAYRRMSHALFLKLWPLKYSPNQWTVIRLRLQAGKLVQPKPVEGFTDADYAQHIMALRKKIPAKGFHYVISKPFVVIGDESRRMVLRRAEHTVGWAVRLLKKGYFTKEPTDIIDIWLFKDRASYLKHNKSIFNYKPSTPFGYFSHRHKALIMNIATGGGTLVHEIVHPFVAANFPQCPSWFDEGLASLYEQCGERGGKIVGFTNWRLRGLQKAIAAKRLPSFRTLASTTRHQFYSEDPGTNYGQARYLCYYLQQRGLLRKYYRAFHANHKKDPTGYETLKDILGVKESDMPAFQKKWEAWVLKLHFP